MLQSDKFKLEMSKSRERLAELTKKDDMTEGETTEMKSLDRKLRGVGDRNTALRS